MALSQQKTTIAVLRRTLGSVHGQEARFAKLAKRSPSWVKKVSAGHIKLSEDTARRLHLETGVSLDWLLGPSDALICNSSGEPYAREDFEWYRARTKAGDQPSKTAMNVCAAFADLVGVGAAAGDAGKTALFQWRVKSFTSELSEEFGFDDGARKIAFDVFIASEVRNIWITDKGMDMTNLLEIPEVRGALAKALAGRKPGDKVNVKISVPPATASSSKQSSRPRPRRSGK